jgi:LPXTG-motif cell wall-anchored protein
LKRLDEYLAIVSGARLLLAAGFWLLAKKRKEERGKGRAWLFSLRHPELDSGSPEKRVLNKIARS